MKTKRQKYPPGWNEKKIRAVIAHYDQQTDEEGAAEIEAAPEATDETLISVPAELVGIITRLIEDHKMASARPRNGRKRK